MEVRLEIKKYNFYLAKINKIRREIHVIENENYNLKSPTIDGLPRASGFSKSMIEEKIINNMDKIEKKTQEIREYQDILNILGGLINTLKESNRKIIKQRYINNQDIKDIAREEYKDYKTIQRIIDNSINTMQINLDKM